MKPKRRILSLLLAICLVVGIMPTAAFAAENGKALQAGAGAIEENDTVYYGTEQRAWQVLSASGNGGTYSDGKNAVQADSALFLFLRSGLRQMWFDDDDSYSNVYQDSNLRKYLNNENVETGGGSEMSGYVSGYFSGAEWANVLETTKTSSADTSLGGMDYSDPGLDGDRLFALSANELAVYLGYTDNPTSWTAGLGGTSDYWLRSACDDDSPRAGAVYSRGYPFDLYVDYNNVWVRPAFNLNLNSVLFTSAAVGGKSSGAEGAGALTQISEYTGSEWKLTLKDRSRSSFSIGTTAVNGNTLTVAYSGATTGTNEYISAVIKDGNGEITYYGRIKQAADSGAASGTVEVTLPADFDSSTDTLYLFSEQYNGDKMTDYAGALQKVSLAKNAYTVTYNLTNVAADTLPAFITGDSDFTAALSISGDYALPESITVTAGGTALTADSSYAYNASTGSLTIYSSAITGDIVITAGAEAAQISAPDVDVQSGESDYASGVWTDSDVTFTISGSSAPSGIAKYQYSINNGQSWTDMTISEGSATLTVSENSATADGTAYIFRAVSNSGGEGTASTAVTVKIDKTEPTISVSGNTTGYRQSDTVTVTPNAGVSGIASVTVSKDGGEAQDITASYANGYTVTSNGTYTFTVTNGAGVTATDSITYDKLDQTKPVVSLDIHGYTSDEWTNGDVTLSVSDTSAALGDTKLEYKVGDGEWQAYTGAVTASEDTNGTVYSFRAVSASGVESETVSVTVKIDKTAPNGDVTIEENSVKKFIHDVTFGLFFKENVEVAITGTDSGSGVQTIEYYRSAKVLTEEQVAALTDWTAYTSAISETAQDAEQFVYYVRITDNAGNTTCFASDGATFDLTKPMITGIADGADYYTTQSVQATDTNLDSVTLNGKKVGTEFTLAGNTETEYVIVAADKAGNETTVTITMHKTEALRENLGDITKDNATSADRETVQDYLDDLKERLKDEKLTDEEKAILEGLADEAQDILDRLDEAEQAGSTEAIDQTQDITSGNVTPEDKEALEQAKEDIEKALDEFGGNYTDEEKAELEEDLSRIEEALDVIERIEDTEAAIEALPDTVNPDDTKAEEQINAAKDLYDALSDYEKSLISADAKDKLEGLLAALCDYRITEGSGSTFTKGSSAGLTFTANGAYSKFTEIEVDGKAVDADGYTVENGRTVITLKAEYLETLAAGKHTLTVLYTDGEATGTFTVAEKSAEVVDDDTESPQTGDDSNIALWIAVLLASGAGISVTAVSRRKRSCKTK